MRPKRTVTSIEKFLVYPVTESERRAYSARRAWERPDYRSRQVQAAKRSHDEAHIRKMVLASTSEEARKKRSEGMRLLWANPFHRARMVSAWTPQRRREQGAKIRAAAARGAYADK